MSISSGSSFADRLRWVIGDEAVYAFGRRAGISDTALRSYLKGSVPSIDKAVKIAQVGQVNLNWLITGEGSPQLHPDAKAEYVYVPFVDVAASAGAGVLVREELIESVVAFERNWLRTHLKGNPAELSLIRVQGIACLPPWRMATGSLWSGKRVETWAVKAFTSFRWMEICWSNDCSACLGPR